MNGIEYSTLASLIQKESFIESLTKQHNQRQQQQQQAEISRNEQLNDAFKQNDFDPRSFKSTYSSSSSSIPAPQSSSSSLNYYSSNNFPNENLLLKLHSMNKCPEYLIPPKSIYSLTNLNSSTSLTSNSANSASVSSLSSPVTSSALNKKENNNPSKNCYYTDDFILLSEFSEIEGPKPLLTIPPDGGIGFNKNEYSLHLMCVDFHSHLKSHSLHDDLDDEDDHDGQSSPPGLSSPPGSPNSDTDRRATNQNNSKSSKFNLTKDTSIINYWDTNTSVAACVHHFTLYDLEARGFVRPFCLAYISYDQTKPILFFEQIRTKFNEITDLLKKSNFNLFKRDLEQRCLDLRFTREFFMKWCQPPNLNDKLTSSEKTDLIKDYRFKLARDFRVDLKTCARLTTSSIYETTRTLQITTIDSLIKELENVLDVIKLELKAKNWLITAPASATQSTNKLNNKHQRQQQQLKKQEVNVNYENHKCASAIDSCLVNNNDDDGNGNDEPYLNRTNRSFTYPLNNKKSSDDHSACYSSKCLRKNQNKTNRQIYYYGLQRPKLFTNILIGNLNTSHMYDVDFETQLGHELINSVGIDFHHLNQSKRLQQNKKMKRLHQLSVETAKQAVNEMRLMQRYFSTPTYLLKYRELNNFKTKSNAVVIGATTTTATAATTSKKTTTRKKSNNLNYFWSITLGDCAIADFSTNIDTYNLNKYSLIKKSNIYNRNSKASHYINTGRIYHRTNSDKDTEIKVLCKKETAKKVDKASKEEIKKRLLKTKMNMRDKRNLAKDDDEKVMSSLLIDNSNKYNNTNANSNNSDEETKISSRNSYNTIQTATKEENSNYKSNESLPTQFHSPLNEWTVNNQIYQKQQHQQQHHLIVQEIDETKNNKCSSLITSLGHDVIVNVLKPTDTENASNENNNNRAKSEQFGSPLMSWDKLEHFLESNYEDDDEDDDNGEENDEDENVDDNENDATTTHKQNENVKNNLQTKMNKNDDFDENYANDEYLDNELIGNNNDENKFIYEGYDDDISYDDEVEDNIDGLNDSDDDDYDKRKPKEENEYDFVNSLLSIEYKPYNQYSTKFDNYLPHYSEESECVNTDRFLLSLAPLTSPAIVYSVFNKCKYQAKITDKLIQISQYNFEETLKKIMNNFSSFFPHLLYSLLKGRPVICVSRYCDDLDYLTAIVDCLSNFIPNSFHCLNDLSLQDKNVSKRGRTNQTPPKYTSSPCHNDIDRNLSDNDYENLKTQSAPQINLNTTSSNQPNTSNQTKPQLKAIFERKAIKLNDLKYCKLFGLSLLFSKNGCCSNDCNGLQQPHQQQQQQQSANNKPTDLFGNDTNKVEIFTPEMLNTNSSYKLKTCFRHHHKHYHYNNNKNQDDSFLLLKYIPITIRNYVSILDLDKGTFLGPKYKGQYLTNCVQKCKSLAQDSICYLYLLSNIIRYYVKIAFLYNYSILFESEDENDLGNKYAELKPHSSSVLNRTKYRHSTTEIETKRKNSIDSIVQENSHKHHKYLINQNCTNASTRRERILRYYSYSNQGNQGELAAGSGSGGGSGTIDRYSSSVNSNSSNWSISSSISSIASALIGIDLKRNQSTQTKYQQTKCETNLNNDLELLKLILASVTSNTSLTSVSNTSASVSAHQANSLINFDQSDLNIVTHILKTLKIKQIYLYNLAIRKKQIKKYLKESKLNKKNSKNFAQYLNGNANANPNGNEDGDDENDDETAKQSNTNISSKKVSTATSGEETTEPISYHAASSTFSNPQQQLTNNNNNNIASNENEPNDYVYSEIQFPLLIEFEELNLFNSKKS